MNSGGRDSCPHSKGGGVGLLYRAVYEVKQTDIPQPGKHLEYLSVLVRGKSLIQLLIVYRPPSSSRKGLSTAGFFEEFEQLLGYVALMPRNLLIISDFNFHWDD